ncbi:hypothetical protein [Pimelobacter simplex]|nr:hypothetical protein [Pimelobacter simplex]SFN19138.1 hypothetical protein SAMN05421671_0048 [Pimelobacter simplex]
MTDSDSPIGPAHWLVLGLVVFACVFFAVAFVVFALIRGAS